MKKILFVRLVLFFVVPAWPATSASPSADFTITGTTTYQTMDGFGASSAFFGLWLPGGLTESQADMFFSTSSGIGLSLLRLRVPPDGTIDGLSIAKQAVTRGATVWATPWTPPAAYKTNNDINNGGYLLASHYQDYANYLANYVTTLKNNGVNLYALSIQNEPNMSTTYESCGYTSSDFHAFIPVLYNTLSSAGLGSVKIMLPEDAGWRDARASDTLGDATTRDMVGIIGAHSYDLPDPPAPLSVYGKKTWQTEVSDLGPFNPSITDGLYWATIIHNFLTQANVSAWHYWWLRTLQSTSDNEGLVDLNFNMSKRGYAIGNWSKFVRPGWVRIGVSGSGAVLVSAFKDPASGSFAIAAINSDSSSASTTFSLSGLSTSTVTPWITSSSLSLAAQTSVNVSGSSFTYTLPANSITTFVASKAIILKPPTGLRILTD
jgi:glucuronoarabinoxylan endo-1,4-beta-xylanase